MFYVQAKRGRPYHHEEEAANVQGSPSPANPQGSTIEKNDELLHSYIQHCQRSREVAIPPPPFVKIYENKLFLTGERLTDGQADALEEALAGTRSIAKYMIKELYIDDCGMTDANFAKILEGICSQARPLGG